MKMLNLNKPELVNKIQLKFFEEFDNKPQLITLTPGRINIIGEHTDYNNGLAMPIAIDKVICNAITKSNHHQSIIYSMNYNDKIYIENKNYICNEDEVWKKIANKVVYCINDDFKINSRFNLVIGGNIPIGCGLSSSSAFIISLIDSILKLHSIKLNKTELAIYCQKIENKILGTAGGLLDQFGIILSKDKYFMLIDFKKNTVEYFSNKNHNTWIIINSKISRELSDSKYLKRIKECNQALNIINKKFNNSIFSLRKINEKMLNSLKNEYPQLYKRVSHVYNENKRVINLREAIKKNEHITIGTILKESHKSLNELYEVSCKEIDYIIEIAENVQGWYGGRIMGGGFGGCSLHLVNSKSVKKFEHFITNCYSNKYDIIPQIFQTSFSNGIEDYKIIP